MLSVSVAQVSWMYKDLQTPLWLFSAMTVEFKACKHYQIKGSIITFKHFTRLNLLLLLHEERLHVVLCCIVIVGFELFVVSESTER